MEPPPRKPDENECCGSGCKRCVFDLYEEEYRIWEKKTKACVGNEATTALRPDVYAGLIIDNIKKLTANTNLYTLASPNSTKIESLKMGQHVIIKSSWGEESVTRQYTPFQGTDDNGNLQLVIKTYDGGLMSSAVAEWKVGDSIQLRGPLGDSVDYFCNKWETVLIVAAGTGITPMVKIVTTILENDQEETAIIVLYACRKYEDILLKDMLDEWRDHWNFTVFYFLSRESDEIVERKKRYKENVRCSRITLKFFKTFTKDQNLNPRSTFSFVCGPTNFEASIEQHFLTCGFFKENIQRF